jgi:hypothetical protein
MNYWWVVASDRDPDHGWHWERFFTQPFEDGERYEWGGADWIRSSFSQLRIEEMRKGDLVVAYQAGEGVLGFIYLATNGFSSELDGKYDSFDLEPSPFVCFKKPIPYSVIRDLPNSHKHFEFVNFHQNTVFRITPKGFELLLYVVLEENPRQKKDIERFLSKGGLQKPLLGSPNSLTASSVLEPPKRIKVEITRVIRDTVKTKRLKKKYDYRCQLCDARIEVSSNKYYAEVHHIRPLGGKHMGLDDEANMLVVCPNHHAYFDLGVPRFLSTEEVLIGEQIFSLTVKHKLGEENLNYHNQEIFGKNW